VLARHSLDPRETEEARRLLEIEVVSLAAQRSTLSDIEMLPDLAQISAQSRGGGWRRGRRVGLSGAGQRR
jgi:DNA-binding FadR family transcriptional regulator